MIKNISLSIGALSVLVLTACQSMEHGTGQKASAALESRSGSSAKGTVNFVWQGNDVLVTGNFSGLKPNSEQGFHVHEKGDCSAPDATSAGGHFNPDTKSHGMPGSGSNHAGDMPNIKSDANGNASYSAKLSGFAVNSGSNGILGRSVVVHRDPDDYKSQPAGNSGPRIACGLIK
ncbi:superoxide dismutase family protein [Polynucleobacter sp. 71A-WALBACH]|uniref:superoxide dismutase family protein n=1 Tax=Polynucleobacter sp. 71A-WALBACH TaxID=2689097 RepID=UPI001C0DE96D|nr:superoxide dismutase family protein [Polynucleobacter sp. 71A-WALBACH]MBU3592874.1 superoxide dismutase family protein [Polynucleobacter sp. 71A-WALBACH]